MLYGYLGGRELFSNSQRYLERRITLEVQGCTRSFPLSNSLHPPLPPPPPPPPPPHPPPLLSPAV